jgi:hypothetical protein
MPAPTASSSISASSIVTGRSALSTAFEQRLIGDLDSDDPAVVKRALDFAAVVYISEQGQKSLFEKIADQTIGRH